MEFKWTKLWPFLFYRLIITPCHSEGMWPGSFKTCLTSYNNVSTNWIVLISLNVILIEALWFIHGQSTVKVPSSHLLISFAAVSFKGVDRQSYWSTLTKSFTNYPWPGSAQSAFCLHLSLKPSCCATMCMPCHFLQPYPLSKQSVCVCVSVSECVIILLLSNLIW